MAKKPAPPPQNPILPQDNSVLQDFNKAVQQADLPFKFGDGTDLGDIAKRALNKTTEGKDLSTIATETLDETPQSPSVQTAKVMAGGERAQAAMIKAEKAIKDEYCEDLSRRDFLTWLFGGCVLGGVSTYIGNQLGFLKGAENFIRDAMKGGPTGRFVEGGSSERTQPAYRNEIKGRVIDSGSAWWAKVDVEKDIYNYFLQVLKDPETMDSAAVFLSSKETYKTPDGTKDGKQITEYFSKDPAKRRYDLIKVRYSNPVTYTSQGQSRGGFVLAEVLGWKSGSSYYYDE